MAGDRPGPRSVDATGDAGSPRDDADSRPRRRPVTDGGTDADTDADGDGDAAARRRRLIKYVLIIAFAVPLVVEGATLVGLVGSYVGDDATAAPTPTPTPDEAITEGSQLLSETERDERVTTISLQSSGDGWTLVVSVRVENTGDLPYELRLGSVTTSGGRTVEGSATTGRVVPGESATVSAQWNLPAGDRPDTISVTAVEYDDGERVLVDRGVRVGRVPVEG